MQIPGAMLKTIAKIANHANPRGQAHGLSPEDRRWAARWVERSIDGRVLEATRERGQQVGGVPWMDTKHKESFQNSWHNLHKRESSQASD